MLAAPLYPAIQPSLFPYHQGVLAAPPGCPGLPGSRLPGQAGGQADVQEDWTGTTGGDLYQIKIGKAGGKQEDWVETAGRHSHRGTTHRKTYRN